MMKEIFVVGLGFVLLTPDVTLYAYTGEQQEAPHYEMSSTATGTPAIPPMSGGFSEDWGGVVLVAKEQQPIKFYRLP